MIFDLRIRRVVIAGMILLWAVSRGFAESPGNARGMATVDIKNSSLERIAKATEDVFTGVGFEIVESDDYSFVFERPGSRWKDISYGGIEGGGVIEQAVVEFEEKSPTLYWVRCDVHMVKGRDSDSPFEEKTRVMKAFGREYQKLLNKVKGIAEQQPMKIEEK